MTRSRSGGSGASTSTHCAAPTGPATRRAPKEGLEELADFDYIAIFDADFKPEPDFLTSTVPYLIDNPEVGDVQARWTFTNPDEADDESPGD